MRRSIVMMMIAGLALVAAVGSSRAASPMVDVQATKRVPLFGEAVATVVSADGKGVFVLHDNGSVAIFEPDGRLRATVQVGVESTDIAVSPDGHRLYVTEKGRKVLKIVDLDYIVALHIGKAPSLGPVNAPVTIVIFSDFQCPYCAKLNPLLQQVMKKYPYQLKLVYKFYPLARIHPLSMPAAIAALAAERQGKFWEYHDALLNSHRELSDSKFIEIAKTIGLDMKRFARDRKDPRLVNRVRNDINEASAIQVRSVPTVFINGHRLKQRSLQGFEQLIQRELDRLVGK